VPSAERTITINQPPSAVFPVIADGVKATLWRSGVLDVTLESGAGKGALYRQGVRGPGGRRIAADYEVMAFKPERRLAFRTITGPVRPEGEFELEPMGGGTILTFRLRAELSGWRRVVLGRAVQASMDAEMAALDRLRDLLER
jgi:uncharacterized protein YndB with AHSA1/START domain